MSRYDVVKMPRSEVDVAIDAAAREGWNPGLNDAECFYTIDPHGFFVGVLDGMSIGHASALIYDQHFAFCGFYIVDEPYRGKGYGLKMTEARLNYIGDRNAGLDGVVDMKDKYARLGYKTSHLSTRFIYSSIEPKGTADEVVPASEVPFEELLEFDTRHFFAERENFLRCWINQSNAVSRVFLDGKKIRGFGVIRECREGFKIGPLFADQPDIAEALFRGLRNQALGKSVLLDVPEVNGAAMKLVNKYRMKPVFSCARMYLRGDPGLPLDNIYGITTFEAG
jgi:hypothetical protein